MDTCLVLSQTGQMYAGHMICMCSEASPHLQWDKVLPIYVVSSLNMVASWSGSCEYMRLFLLGCARNLSVLMALLFSLSRRMLRRATDTHLDSTTGRV